MYLKMKYVINSLRICYHDVRENMYPGTKYNNLRYWQHFNIKILFFLYIKSVNITYKKMLLQLKYKNKLETVEKLKEAITSFSYEKNYKKNWR